MLFRSQFSSSACMRFFSACFICRWAFLSIIPATRSSFNFRRDSLFAALSSALRIATVSFSCRLLEVAHMHQCTPLMSRFLILWDPLMVVEASFCELEWPPEGQGMSWNFVLVVANVGKSKNLDQCLQACLVLCECFRRHQVHWLSKMVLGFLRHHLPHARILLCGLQRAISTALPRTSSTRLLSRRTSTLLPMCLLRHHNLLRLLRHLQHLRHICWRRRCPRSENLMLVPYLQRLMSCLEARFHTA